ncbi:RNA-guided pseudouridylation complex pseudouridine synthase subunit Cbf5 [Natronobacterium gregoryi]|uniref:Probable tRNA pseudouridine synthase B n=2 Tax=Natronobacterium gregoryi TaxID=44930 RepID=L0AEC1_NATGS|nr:RNA-guided pseudouridylation complex pseudouridine synthase subunit Cbf5 [Natronobacterium gregoryi]AFZ71410.1 rRNA pseudouridine synthase, putative [Natronobacterium gregoryi SP2]ELY66935.1 H/ACA RNA-protein complex component Cbf5p [Natronobacterium gregoryi SP2]PLK21211.1 RNA-guided pseudouridylation complex pseudouridine synthase subunit Cbf5 [Natronobacterium gregoryi SP2]SFI84413.1 tRNA pseudouridine55 synthase [Natronobacterium gregoryi]
MTPDLRAPPDDRLPEELLPFGVVNLDKPPGPSSHQVSGWLRDAVDETLDDRGVDATIDRAAHAGTLDPKVTGCLPVMFGEATRLAQVFLEGPKEYVAVLECHSSVPADAESIVAAFEGPIYQKPPRKSAVSRRLRVREMYDLEVLEAADRRLLLRIRCESGTYVRKLCHDLGLALGTGGHMGDLRRTGTSPFDDSSLHSVQEFLDALAFWVEDDDPEPLYEVVEPAERILEEIPGVVIAENAAHEVAEGAPVYAPGVLTVDDDASRGDLVACYTPDGSAVALGELVGSVDAESGVVVDLERVLV